jgi:hypothetical protein
MIRNITTTPQFGIPRQIEEFANIELKSLDDVQVYSLMQLFPAYPINKMMFNFMSLGRTKEFMLLDLIRMQLSFAPGKLSTHLNGDYVISLTMTDETAATFKF